MPKKNPLGELDVEFDEHHHTLFLCPYSADVSEEVMGAAKRMVEIARIQEDPMLWGYIFARMNDFTSAGVPPPLPLLQGVTECLVKFDPESGESLDAAFGFRSSKKGRRSTFKARQDQILRASIVDFFIRKRGCKIEEATARTADKLAARFTDGGLQGTNGCVTADQCKKEYYKWRGYVYEDVDWDEMFGT